MYSKKFLPVLFVLLFSVQCFPQKPFEGKIDYKMTQDDQTTMISYFVKEGKIKMDIKGEGNASMLFNGKTKKMIILMPEEKMYMEMPMEFSEKEMKEAERKSGEFEKTGQKKAILGYTCEKWVYTDDESSVESWLTKELGSFFFFSNPMEQRGGDKPTWQSKLESEGYFPLEFTVKDRSGDTESHMVVTSVEKKALDGKMFELPPGYQKLQMPGM